MHQLQVFQNKVSLSSRHDTSSGCGWTRRPPDMDSSCEYVE